MSLERQGLLQDEERNEQTTTRESSVLASSGAATPLPWRVFSALLLLTAVQGMAFGIVIPFVNQMIVEIGVVDDPEQVGFYSGLIESTFSCISFIAVMPMSYLADRIGRKPVILGGMTGVPISVASFGMSKSLAAMILSRCISGALGGVWACSKIMVGEMTDRSNQAMAFQWLGNAHRIGQVVGLPLGGLLAHPARNFTLFQIPFWCEYPFALPCFVASISAGCFIIVGYFTLPETLASKKPIVGRSPTYGTVSPRADTESISSTRNNVSATDNLDESTHRPSIRSILTPETISVLISNVVMCLASGTLFSVFPLFSFTPIASGGLGLSEAAIGTQMAIRAVLNISMAALYAPLERYFGSTLRLHRVIMWGWPLTIFCAPLLNLMARRAEEGTWSFNIALFVFSALWAATGFTRTSMSIMITETAPSPNDLATINGLAQMASILTAAISPVFVTSLFAFSIQSGILGGNLTWIILFAFTCAGALHSMTLREPVNAWRKECRSNDRTFRRSIVVRQS